VTARGGESERAGREFGGRREFLLGTILHRGVCVELVRRYVAPKYHETKMHVGFMICFDKTNFCFYKKYCSTIWVRERGQAA
jgi:hypothetical protein